MDKLERVNSLFSLCRAFPIQNGFLNWGHTYGLGLLDLRKVDDRANLAPGAETILQVGYESPRDGYESPRDQDTDITDPYTIPPIRWVFRQPGEDSGSQSPQPLRAPASDGDVFRRLPQEMLLSILVNLPSSDVVHLMQASRVFSNVALPDSFWMSRFFKGRDYDHIFEAQDYFSSRSHKGQWSRIFNWLRTEDLRTSSASRRRVWGLAASLHHVLDRMEKATCEEQRITSPDDEDIWFPLHSRTQWALASRARKLHRQNLDWGSRALYASTLHIPLAELSAIFISSIDLFGRCYISGIQILDSNGKSHALGYTHPNKKLIQPPRSTSRITGFRLAQDQRGIRGMSLIFDDGLFSSWSGDHHGIPKRRLVLTSGRDPRPVHCLESGQDVSGFERPFWGICGSWVLLTDFETRLSSHTSSKRPEQA